MAENKIIMLSDVRREKRVSKDGTRQYETLNLISTDDEIFGGYINTDTIVPKIGDMIDMTFQIRTKKNGETFNSIISFKRLKEESMTGGKNE